MVDFIFTAEPVKAFLSWVLVFVLFFAILEKSNLLGKDKRQINAILAAVIGLLLLAFPASGKIIVDLIPFLVVSAVILFVFMMLYGFMAGKKDEEYVLNKGLKIALGIIIGIAVIVAVLYVTGKWDDVVSYMNSSSGREIWINLIFVAIIIGAISAVLGAGGKSKSKE